jgi:type I restriction enzyme R subunit
LIDLLEQIAQDMDDWLSEGRVIEVETSIGQVIELVGDADFAVIAELVAMAQEISAETQRGAHFSPPLDEDQLAFYDAVAQNPSAVDVLGEGVLAAIARDLVAVMQRDIRTDWTVREAVRARLRSSIRRLLAKYKYPPDKQPEAIKLVMEQMESMAPRYAGMRRTGQVN